MNRNMKVANTTIFQRLITFADERGFPVPNPSAPRWVHSNEDADKILVGATIPAQISFGRYRHLAWLEFRGRHYVGSVGFDHELEDQSLAILDDVQGFDVCLLSELRVMPRETAAEVFNVVAAGSKADDPSYGGHDNERIMSLFPTVRVYECTDDISDEVVWSVFLGLCVEESRHGDSWIERELADALAELAQANVDSMPYSELCRSVLDLDPRSLYMNLYRCIEATYAHDKASRLKTLFSLRHSWNEIAAVLESEMSWRPLEAQ